jgi:hypothetical protein
MARVMAAVALALLALPSLDAKATTRYPLHTGITATVFWVGEPKGGGSSEDNALSAWDDDWLQHYGAVDEPFAIRSEARSYFPSGFGAKENPFYFDLPYNDFLDSGSPRPGRLSVIPWARAYTDLLARYAKQGKPFSLLKNRWAKISRHGRVCYAQWEDSGPYVYGDAAYVFGKGDQRPRSMLAQNAGMDVSPAVRDCLGFVGLDNADNTVDWRFVDAAAVPHGPWKRVVTTRQVHWQGSDPAAAD